MWTQRSFRAVSVLAGLIFATLAQVSHAACPSCVPLDDLTAPPHRGQMPGLYPGVTNDPPAAHLALALDAAARVVPRDAAGAFDPDGFIGLISIGMSNTNQEFSVFERQDDLRAGRNARLVIVNTAVGGQSADIIVNPAAPYWNTVRDRIQRAGLDPDQIQVAWLKEADGSVPDTSFPNHAVVLQGHLHSIVRDLKSRFPNLELCYFASRTYGGWGTSPERGEPLSFETAYSVRWLIEQQMSGDPLLNADPDVGAVEAPVLLWGAYLWANGATPRASDGHTWLLADVENDRVHPSPSGEQKAADLLSTFFAAEDTALPWKDASTGEGMTAIDAEADAYVDDTHPTTNYGSASTLTWSNPSLRSYARFDLGGVTDSVFHAKLSLKTLPDVQIGGVEVVVVSNTTWNESTITAATAPAFDGAVLGMIPQGSRGTAVSLDVTSAVQAALASGPGAKVSLGLRMLVGPTAAQQVGSRESIDPPRLVLSTIPTVSGVEFAAPLPEFRLVVNKNPLTAGGTLRLVLGQRAEQVTVQVFDVKGVLVRGLFSGALPAGAKVLGWDGRDGVGRLAPRGLYLIEARIGWGSSVGRVVSEKVVLVRG